MYANEKKYVWPFMSATVGLFLAGAWFGYHWVLPGAIKVLILDFGKNYNHMITIDEYTGFFLSVILGLGICFELPILIFFLALFGIVDAKFLLRQFRYAILAIFIVAAIICPMPDPYQHVPLRQPHALPLLLRRSHRLVCPSRPPQKAEGGRRRMTTHPACQEQLSSFDRSEGPQNILVLSVAFLRLRRLPPQRRRSPHHSSGSAARPSTSLTQQFLAVAPKRYNGSPGHLAAENFIKEHFKPEAAKGNFETDQFTANTPAGMQTMRNYIVRYPGKKDGVIVLATPLRDQLPAAQHRLRRRQRRRLHHRPAHRTRRLLPHPPAPGLLRLAGLRRRGRGCADQWSDSDSLYGTRHLAAKWYADGTLKRIKAFIVADMIGDKDLNILEEMATPLPGSATCSAKPPPTHHHTALRLQAPEAMSEDDHLPFLKRGVPSLDVIDVDYGPHTDRHARRLPPHRPGHHRQAQPQIPPDLRRPLPRNHPPHQPAPLARHCIGHHISTLRCGFSRLHSNCPIAIAS